MAKAHESNLRKALKRAGSDIDGIRELIQRPEKFAEKAGLSREDAASLRGADFVIAVTQNPIAALGDSASTQTTSPITITGHHGKFSSGDPPNFSELEKEQLINVLRKSLNDPTYAQKLRELMKR
jgi:hypothetical protein